MREPATGEIQLRRLREAGMNVALMPCLTDVGTITDAIEVAAMARRSCYTAALAGIGAAL
jgi:L-alanine-DL-glutamate epimerase-like enolase superfamily enzyme